ncbi:MAG: hypothetical protein KAR12_13690 [Methylococcales bacterium]|nr:hypothetical protein [Methylococcales bacterium]
MKNSFFLVIPAQQKNPDLLVTYESAAVNQWVSELPTANPSLASRLFYDFVEEFNSIEMSAQKRLDILEILRPHFLTIEDYLRSRLILSGFPKGENEQKILNLIVSIEKHFTIGYWMAVRELTRRDVGWFQGKNTALAIQRTIKGLNEIVVTHYMMFLPVPDWIWIDLHSLYKLSIKVKKESTKVPDETSFSGKMSTAEDCYKQVLLLSLADPSGLMQKEVQQVYDFVGKISQSVQIEKQPIKNQKIQCVILMDEDTQPYFDMSGNQADTAMMYLNLLKLYKMLQQADNYSSKDDARFSSMHILRSASKKLPAGLFEYVLQCWQGVELKGGVFFADRLDRNIVIGLEATHSLQSSLDFSGDKPLEVIAESYSERELSCKFDKEGVLSIGSLISYRKTDEHENKRFLGIVKKITMPKQNGHIVFEISSLTPQSYAVTYAPVDAAQDSNVQKALLYGVRNGTEEKSFIIMDSFMHKDNDVVRLYMNDDNFPIVLRERKNIGLGYWQFECKQIEEKQISLQAKKKGYDFI